MPDYFYVALVVVAAFAIAVTVFAVNHRRARYPRGSTRAERREFAARRKARRDDLTALADAVSPQWHDYEIEALRALFHADQNPQPSRRKR